MKIKGLKYFMLFSVLAMMEFSCQTGPQITRTDTETSGLATIAIDESFAPIINEELTVFEALNPEAIITPLYTGDAEAYDLLMKDSVRLIFGTRELTKNEQELLKERKQRARTQIFAIDAIALIINNENPDSLITLDAIKKIMTGEISTWKEINPNSKLGEIKVSFDSPNSSIVRYMKDSICEGKPFGLNVEARSENSVFSELNKISPNQKVVDYVANNKNALGIVGVNWISNPNDSLKLSFGNKVQVMSISSESKAFQDNSYKPLPYQIALKKYPLRRELYIIITDSQGGLPSGFVKFAVGDQGQRIVLRSGLLPGINPIRLVRINATAN